MTDQTAVETSKAPEPKPSAAPAPAPAPAPEEHQRKSISQIAKDVFGKDYHGAVEPPKPAPVIEGDEIKPEVEEPPVDATEGEEPEEGAKKSPEEGTSETPIATVSELVEHLETNPEWFNGLKMSFSVDGTPTEATISQLVESYQPLEAARHRLEDAKKYAEANAQALAEKQNALEGQFRVAAELIKGAEANLERDIKAIDPQLRDQDPAEWAARKTEFDQRRADIQGMKDRTVAEYSALARTRAVEMEQVEQQFVAGEQVRLLEALPEWRDEQKANAEKAEIAEYLRKSGFGQNELAQLYDHRLLVQARKAMLYDKSRTQVDAAKKKVVTVPKMMKPGAPKTKDQLSSERLEQLRLKSVKSGSLEDATAYRMAKLGVSR